ncbi:MAG TPA: VWA domain-containing protein, partial [Polyangiales bacterium]
MSRRARPWLVGLAVALISLALALIVDRSLAGRELSVHGFGCDWSLRAPSRLALSAILPLMAAASRFGLVDQSRGQRALSFAARALLVACLSLALSRPTCSQPNARVSVVIAADASDSLSASARARERAFIERACAAASPPCALIEFAATAQPLRAAAELERPDVPAEFRRQTDLQAALQLAYGSFADGFARRFVLLSDGKQTRGDVELETERAARLGVEIDYRLFDDAAPAEVALRALQLPAILEVGRPFRIEAGLFANVASDVTLRLFEGSSPAPLETRALHLEAGETPVEFPALLRVSGPVAYRVELTPHTGDQFAENNRASATGFVRGRPRVLWVDPDPPQLMAASSALQQHGFDVELRQPIGLPRTAAELDGYDFFILEDVAAERLASGTFELVERYVRDRGGGFMMVGGDHSFGLGGYRATRWAKLLPVQMAGEVHRDDHSLALALLIDCSGSMAGSKIDLAKEAARASVEVLADDDLIEVVGFAGEPERQVRMQSARNRLGVMQNIGRLIAQGGTQLFPALDLAYQDLALARARIKHVILLTDGQTQESGIPEIVQTMRSENITVSTVGLGRDVNRELLQIAAGMGGGRAYFTDDPRNVPRIFV